jgi:hypothetical protein
LWGQISGLASIRGLQNTTQIDVGHARKWNQLAQVDDQGMSLRWLLEEIAPHRISRGEASYRGLKGDRRASTLFIFARRMKAGR